MSEYKHGRGPHFAQIPFALQDDPEVDAYAIAVYAALKRFCHFGRGTGAEVSDAAGAKKAGCGVRKFRERREWLKARGWIEWESESGRVNSYVVHSSLTSALDAGVGEHMDTTAPHAEVENATSSVDAADAADATTMDTTAPRAEVRESAQPRHDVPTTTAPHADPPRHHMPTTKRQLPRTSTEKERNSVSSLRSETGAGADVENSRQSRRRQGPQRVAHHLAVMAGAAVPPDELEIRELISEVQKIAWLRTDPPKGDVDRAHQIKLIRELGPGNRTQFSAALRGARAALGSAVPFGVELLATRARGSQRRLLEIFADRHFKNDHSQLSADVMAAIRQAIAA